MLNYSSVTINPLEERFWSKVDKKGPDQCWEWKGLLDKDNYGKISNNKKSLRTHRVSYELNIGKIPDGLYVCHTCDNPKCVNPTHLFLGTQKDNLQDASKKGRIALGEKNGDAKLTENQVIEIRNSYNKGNVTMLYLAKKYGVGRSTIDHVIKLHTWVHKFD